MADIGVWLANAWALALAALLVSIIAYPFVFAGHWLYGWLVDKYEEAPKFVLLFIATFALVLVFLILLEQYLGVSMAQAAATFASATPTP